MKDRAGKEIQVGHYIAYAVKHRSEPDLNFGLVLKVFEDKVTVQGVENSGGCFNPPTYKDLPGLISRASNLHHSNRVLVVDQFAVPEDALILLDKWLDNLYTCLWRL